VGIHGKGESIWLGFFLYTVLKRFAVLARQYGDEAFARQCDTESTQLQQNLENHGWDGEWYRRAYFDDGTPLGSSRNTECRIDSIAQSWSVLSEAAPLARAKQAMTSLNHYLVKPQDKLVLLLDPPFNTSRLNPGYIKGYVPGVRENGGQYTHAAIWAAMAFAKLGENQLSWSLFTIINPVQHGDTAEKIEVYKIEPYVMAADVYSTMPHTGRGGWSWYTGSAGWMYHFITESLLGLKLQRKHLSILPCIPDEWEGFQLTYHYGKTIYQIKVSRTSDTPKIILDGIELSGNIIPLVDDQHTHEVNVHIIRK
jgi:cyclic beta-1,2-glucan synthetase